MARPQIVSYLRARCATPRMKPQFEHVYSRLLHLENNVHLQLIRHSVSALRIAVGLVFFGFGVLKYLPGVSPAENLTKATTDILFFGLVPGNVAIVMIATLECFIGLCLLANRGMRVALWLLTVQFVGILSPLVVLPGRLFSGLHHAPTLEGQYVLKDIILVGAAMVIAAVSFRGGRLVRGDLPPAHAPRSDTPPDAAQKLQLVLDGGSDEAAISELCERAGVSEADYHHWRETSLQAARDALEESTIHTAGA